jgi:hypothetical protein
MSKIVSPAKPEVISRLASNALFILYHQWRPTIVVRIIRIRMFAFQRLISGFLL